MSLQPFQQRVLDEKSDLDGKIEKLSVFIMTSNIFSDLSYQEQSNLDLQLNIMQSYSKILDIRICNW